MTDAPPPPRGGRAVSSSDPDPAGCRQEAKRAALRRLHRDRGGGCAAPVATGVSYRQARSDGYRISERTFLQV
jgi:hypothetical protein